MKPQMNDTLKPQNPIMIVDDEESIIFAIDTALQMAGMNNIISCQDSREVLKVIEKQTIEALLLDLNMPHIDGEKLLEKINQNFPEIPIIIVTGEIDVETAVRCMKTGAFDYLLKPVDEGRLITSVNRAISHRELIQENIALKQHILKDTLEKPDAFDEIITNNKKMYSIFQYIESIAPSRQAVLITGETGVGKEMIAKAIHKLSNFSGNFVAVNVAGLDDNVFSDTLFGHSKGAFTGADRVRSGLIEHAAGGTLFLDEIGDLSIASQVKLLRLLQEGEYLPLGQDNHKKADVRILAATNENLWNLQKEGKFRKDLNYRFRTHHINLPPLRERMDDIPLLADHFFNSAATELNKKKPTVPKELFTLLKTYSFPGNIRELQAMIFDAVSRHKSKILSLGAFKLHIDREQDTQGQTIMESDSEENFLLAFPEQLPTIKHATNLLISEAMKRGGGNQSIASRFLGISQQALSKRLKNLKEEIAQWKPE